MSDFTVLSLFSGIGGFDLGLERAGMTVVAQVEVDAYCDKTLARHWPQVRRLRDVRSVGAGSFGLGRAEHHSEGEQNPPAAGEPDAPRAADVGGGLREQDRPQRKGRARAGRAAAQGGVGADGKGRLGPVDLVCGGFPCQDLSVAGQRAGLDGARSGLWFEFQRILSELRPRWALIENVPGLLSSNQGRDFAVLLDGLGECGFGGIAWAVLDSQNFGVAQRRRRVFIVAGPDRRSVEQVLSLCESCGGHPPKGRAAREGVATPVGGGATGAGRTSEALGESVVLANPLGAKADGGWRGDLDHDTYIPEVVGTLDTALGHHGYGTSAQSAQAGHFLAIRTAQTSANGHGLAEDVAHTLDGAGGQAVAGTFAIQERAVSEGTSGPDGVGVQEGLAYTMEGRPKTQMVAHALTADGFDASEDGTGRGTPMVTDTLRDHPRPGSNTTGNIAAQGMAVRRLTPTECERLQGFPDGWTDGADGPRYRALGNAVTVPVIEYLGLRIMAADAATESEI